MRQYRLLHLNIEKKKHLDEVAECIEKHQPDIICLEEVYDVDLQNLANQFGYFYAHAPKFIAEQIQQGEGQGILSKYILENINLHHYGDTSDEVPIFDTSVFSKSKPKRPLEQFTFREVVLSAEVVLEKTRVTIATTHFPVADHTSPGLHEHELFDIDSLNYVQNTRNYFDRFLEIIKKLPQPLIFTSDFNNPRGEYMYDALAHELIDQVPQAINSSIDPVLHRVPDLKLMVDAIMTSSDVYVVDVRVIEGVSDHKGFIITFQTKNNPK